LGGVNREQHARESVADIQIAPNRSKQIKLFRKLHVKVNSDVV